MQKNITEGVISDILSWHNKQVTDSWINYFRRQYTKYSKNGMITIMRTYKVPNEIIDNVITRLAA